MVMVLPANCKQGCVREGSSEERWRGVRWVWERSRECPGGEIRGEGGERGEEQSRRAPMVERAEVRRGGGAVERSTLARERWRRWWGPSTTSSRATTWPGVRPVPAGGYTTTHLTAPTSPASLRLVRPALRRRVVLVMSTLARPTLSSHRPLRWGAPHPSNSSTWLARW